MPVPLNIEIPCAHPVAEKVSGRDTGKYVCMDCGQVFKNRQEWTEAREKLLHAPDSESEE